MYYNSDKNNSDYYNSYKQEMATVDEYHEGFSFQKIVKIGFTILMVGLMSILTIYLVNYFSTDIKKLTTLEKVEEVHTKTAPTIAVSKESLPKSIQVEAREPKMNSEEIAYLVGRIIKQINHKKIASLEHQLLSAETHQTEIKKLEESNHYNKVVVPNKNHHDIIERQKILREALNTLLKEPEALSSDYEQAIAKEINTRSNEMRVIVVQKGDTLSKIAKKAYGDVDAYPKILMANPEVVKNPNEIFVGQRLRIPA